MSDERHYSEILDLPDLPSLSMKEMKRLQLCKPWDNHSTAWIGDDAFCKVRYNGKDYRNRVYRRQPTQAGD